MIDNFGDFFEFQDNEDDNAWDDDFDPSYPIED